MRSDIQNLSLTNGHRFPEFFFQRMVFYLWLFLGETDLYGLDISFLLLESSPISQNKVTIKAAMYFLLFCSCYVRLANLFMSMYLYTYVMLSILLKTHRLLLAYGCLCYTEVNPFPNDIFWTLPNSECANNKFKFDESERKISKQVENTLGKGEIARKEQFLLSSSVIKRLVLQTRKNQGLFGKGLREDYCYFWVHRMYGYPSLVVIFSLICYIVINFVLIDIKQYMLLIF